MREWWDGIIVCTTLFILHHTIQLNIPRNMNRILVVGGSILLAVGASPARTVLDGPARPAPRWALHSNEPVKQDIELTFAVTLSNTDKLEESLLKVSSPSSADYGKLFTLEQVEQLTRPAPEALEVVSAFLRSYGAADIQYSSGFLRAVLPVEMAEKMLEAKYSTFRHEQTGEVATRCSSYSLPEEVARHVDFVAPTVGFPQPMQVRPEGVHTADTYQNTPQSLRALYGLDDAMGGKSEARQGKQPLLCCDTDFMS